MAVAKKVPFQIRIDEDLLEKVRESANESERTINAEMRYLIKLGLKHQKEKNT
jgi:hypothetical protein